MQSLDEIEIKLDEMLSRGANEDEFIAYGKMLKDSGVSRKAIANILLQFQSILDPNNPEQDKKLDKVMDWLHNLSGLVAPQYQIWTREEIINEREQ
jgi:hypothetical protein